jgi:hypothetical protein
LVAERMTSPTRATLLSFSFLLDTIPARRNGRSWRQPKERMQERTQVTTCPSTKQWHPHALFSNVTGHQLADSKIAKHRHSKSIGKSYQGDTIEKWFLRLFTEPIRINENRKTLKAPVYWTFTSRFANDVKPSPHLDPNVHRSILL